MAAFDPVDWEAIVAVRGEPGVQVRRYVDRLAEDVADDPPGVAVKTVYDTWKEKRGADRSPSDQGAAFLIAYLLEQKGVLALETASGDGPSLPSMSDRRPAPDTLEAWFWEREWPLWYVAVETGTHMSLVYYWLWEDDVPLMERNFLDDTLAEIKSHQSED